jgi:nucleoid-associated protein YgaU
MGLAGRTDGRVMSRTVIWLVVAGALVVAVGLGVAWQGKLSDRAVLEQAAKSTAGSSPATSSGSATPGVPPAAPPSVATNPSATASPSATANPSASANPSAAANPSATATPSPPASQPAVAPPSFDIARIGPDGRAVVAGRATPGAKIVLLDGGREIARGEADARGEWVVIVQDAPLSAGQHELRVVQHIEGRAPVTSDQVVVAVVPAAPPGKAPAAPPGKAPAAPGTASKPAPGAQPSAGAGAAPPKEETLVLIAPSAGAATLVQPPSPAGVPKSGDLVMSTLDYDERGHVTVTGQATPGTVVRVYINDNMVAEGRAAADGRWRLAPPDPVGPGKYTLRLDRLAGDGKATSRLELPFERVIVSPGPTDGRRLIVVRGDNLWNIARAHYGTGFHHTVIYGANKDQIRDPDLIYPGQVFSLPKVN